MKLAQAHETAYESLQCGECGITFYVPDYWHRARSVAKEDDGRFTCPNGHHRIFSESVNDRLRKTLAAKESELARERDMRRAAEEQQVKLRRKLSRTSKGVCPCCKRSFVALQRHMASKHPEFKP